MKGYILNMVITAITNPRQLRYTRQRLRQFGCTAHEERMLWLKLFDLYRPLNGESPQTCHGMRAFFMQQRDLGNISNREVRSAFTRLYVNPPAYGVELDDDGTKLANANRNWMLERINTLTHEVEAYWNPYHHFDRS